MLEVALENTDHGDALLRFEEDYEQFQEDAHACLTEWFFDSLPDEAGERTPTGAEETYVCDLGHDFADLVIEDIEDEQDVRGTLASLPR